MADFLDTIAVLAPAKTEANDFIDIIRDVRGDAADLITAAQDPNCIYGELVIKYDDFIVKYNETIPAIATVLDSMVDVSAVANNIVDVNTVGTNIVNVSAAGANTANIDAVVGIGADVTTVAGISVDTTTVASISAAVVSLYTDKLTLDSLYADKVTLDSIVTDKLALDSIFADKVTLDSIFADKAVLDSLYADKLTLDSIFADKITLDSLFADKVTLDRVVTSIGNIDRVFTSIDNLDTVYTSVANVDTVAASITDVNVVSTNITDITNYFDVEYGPLASDPTTRNDSSAMQAGDKYFNTTDSRQKVYNGTVWNTSVTDSDLTDPVAVKALNQGVATTDTPTFAGIVTAGTVDGRDLSVDGTKLDLVTVTQAVNLDTIESDTALNNAKVSDINHNVTTDLSTTVTSTTNTVVSSDGTDAILPAVTTIDAGVMVAVDKVKLDGIEDGAQVNIAESYTQHEAITEWVVPAPVARQYLSDLVVDANGHVTGGAVAAEVDQTTITGNAGTATTLETARTIGITGDITATAVAFDGSLDINITAAVNDDSHSHTDATLTGVETATVSTVAQRDASGDLVMRLPRVEYASDGWTGLYLLGTNALGGVGTDNYVRPTPVPVWNQDTTGNATTATSLVGQTSTITEVNYTSGVTSAIQTQLDSRVVESADTGSAKMPVGTTADRDATPADGWMRFNSDLNAWESYSSVAGLWLPIGGGATGGGTDDVFYENSQTVTVDYSITAGKNAITAGPVSIADGVTVTVPDGSTWVIA